MGWSNKNSIDDKDIMSVDKLYKTLIESKEFLTDDDIDLIKKAFKFAQKAHEGQFRNLKSHLFLIL